MFFIYINMHLTYIILLLKIVIVLLFREKHYKVLSKKVERSNFNLFCVFPKITNDLCQG